MFPERVKAKPVDVKHQTVDKYYRMFGRKTLTKNWDEKTLCPACGGAPAREHANYCLDCGKILDEDYQPLDRLRSSYRLQGKGFLIENTKRVEISDLFAVNRNAVSETAWASCVYSMVPYVGIVFVPFTIFLSVLGFGLSLRRPTNGGGKMSAASFGLSFVVMGVQLFLWWLFYVIPDLSRPV